MGKSENIIKFEEALKTKEKREAYEAALKKIIDEKSAKSDGEAVQKAAKELGFDLSIEELERCVASKQEIADDELDKVAGGWCWFDHSCNTVTCHDKDDLDACWSEYLCLNIYYDFIGQDKYD